jgi:hypothetical protein
VTYPETRPDGSPLATELTDAIRHWFCRSGIDLASALRNGIINEAQLLQLWNARDDRLAGKQCAPDGHHPSL